jgi:hypothetical protein
MCGCRNRGGGGGGGTRDTTRSIDSTATMFMTRAVAVTPVPGTQGVDAPAPPMSVVTRKRKPLIPLSMASGTTIIHLAIIDTAIWGPPMWRVLHTLSLHPAVSPADIRELLRILQDGIPCPECTDHYRAWYAAKPIGDDTVVSRWIADLHNEVNTRKGTGTGTATVTWTYEQVTSTYGSVDVAALDADIAALRTKMGAGVVAVIDRIRAGV